MLVLTHKVGQAIFIGNPRDGAAPIEITVEEVRGDNIRLTSAHSSPSGLRRSLSGLQRPLSGLRRPF